MILKNGVTILRVGVRDGNTKKDKLSGISTNNKGRLVGDSLCCFI